MKNLLIFLTLLCLLYLIGFIIREKTIHKYRFMSFEHSQAYRGIAALVIMLQHVAGGIWSTVFYSVRRNWSLCFSCFIGIWVE